jgi:hypothetical protein
MVRRWRCRHCSFTVWSASRTEAVETVKSHLLDHHSQQVTEQDFQTRWDCPYCESSGQNHDKAESVEEFKEHIFEHVEPLMEPNVHIADEIGGTGNVLVRAPTESAGADNARVHFLAPCDIALFVTTTPARRIRLIDERLDEWPAWIIVVTTKANPLAGVDGIDISNIPLEVVQLGGGLGLQDLGETISRILEEQDTTQANLSVEFDILSEIVQKFETQTVFKFLHILSQRLERSGALSHYYVDQNRQSESVLNILDELFDLSITARGNAFIWE